MKRLFVLLLCMGTSLCAFAQQKITITSSVFDSKAGDVVIGASIIEVGTLNGVITDIDGQFTITAPENSQLEVSCMGYKTIVLPAGNFPAKILLEPDTQYLEEVVVVGYGVQKKVNLTGAVSAVDGEKLAAKPTANAMDALMGAMPGVQINRSGGQPGAEGQSIQIRGFTSTNSTSVLVLIDGVEGDLALVNSNDIESISVLKDAAAASIYGARAAAGVVLVTTKKGIESDRAKIDYSGYVSFLTPTHMPQRVNAQKEQEMINLARLNANGAAEYNPEWTSWVGNPNFNYRENTNGRWEYFGQEDWVDAALKDVVTQHNHHVSVSGGSKKINYMASLGYYRKNGLLRVDHDRNERISGRINLNTQLNKYMDLSINGEYANNAQYAPAANFTYHNTTGASAVFKCLWMQCRNRQPIHNYDTEASTTYNHDLQQNPINVMNNGGVEKNIRNNYTINANLKIHDLLPGLAASLNVARRYTGQDYSEENKTLGAHGLADNSGVHQQYAVNNPNSFIRKQANSIQDKYEALITYNKEFTSGHNLSALLGATYESYRTSSMTTTVKNLTYENLFSLNYYDNSDPNNTDVEDYIGTWAMNSYFGRINYSYKDRYLFEANARYDGSSRLDPSNRWHLFPSFSAGWRLDKEDWFKVPVISNLKVRASWGQLGNGAVLGYYDYLALINASSQPIGDGSLLESIYYQSKLASKDKTWEVITSTNVGLDLGLFDGKLNLSADYYWKTNDNMLATVQLPSTIGISASQANVGKLKTWGWEVELSYNDRFGDVDFHAAFNLSDSQNRLVSYSGQSTVREGVNSLIEGYPLNTIWAYQTDGFWSSREEYEDYKLENPGYQSFEDAKVSAGDVRYVAQGKANHTIGIGNAKPGDCGDLIHMGDTSPRFIYGLTLGAKWKGLDASILFQGVGKRNVIYDSASICPFSNTSVPLEHMTDYWTEDNQDARFPRMYDGGKFNYRPSDKWVENAAYIRLKNFQVGYSVPFKSNVISKMRVYVTGQDVWDYSHLIDAFDPECPNYTTINFYPYFATWAIGVNLTF